MSMGKLVDWMTSDLYEHKPEGKRRRRRERFSSIPLFFFLSLSLLCCFLLLLLLTAVSLVFTFDDQSGQHVVSRRDVMQAELKGYIISTAVALRR